MEQAPRHPLYHALTEIGRTLESLRERLKLLDGADAQPSAATPDTPAALPRVEVGQPLTESQQQALAHFQEILSIPPTGLEPMEVFCLTVDRITRLLIVDRAVLFLLDPDQGRLQPRAARGFRQDDLAEFSLLPGEGLVGRAFREGRSLIYATPVGEAPTDPFIFRFPVRDAAALPIRAGGEVVGVVFAGRRGRPAPFTVEEIQVLTLLADRIGTALVHRRLVEKFGGHVDHLKELVGLVTQTGLRHDLRDVLSMACEAGCRLLRVRAAIIALLGENGQLTVRGSYGMPEEAVARWRVNTESGVTGEIIRSGQVVVCADLLALTGPDDPSLKEFGTRGLLAVPIRIRDELVGCFYLADRGVKDFSADQVEAAQLLGALAGLAIENGQLYGELRQAFDELTAAQERLVQSEKARALEEMAGGLAHEFNNILAIILGKTQLMLERAGEGQLREDLAVIEEAAWRAADMVRRLQGFARVRTTEGPALTDLSALVQEAVALSRPRWKDEAEAQGIRVEVVLDLAETAPVLGTPGELREMLINLILNALDAMPRGGRLSLSTRRHGNQVELRVTDTGTGMTEAVRRRLFDPFFTTRSPQRVGLGLSVVRGVVGRHQGAIEVESREGEGTTFTIAFSLARTASGAPASASAPAGEGPAAPARVLLVEDEEHIRATLAEVLSAAGHAVETAKDGLEALARFQRGRYDVVITDLSMPGRSGLEVTRAVKQIAPGTPVILITGWGDVLDPARIRESGVDFTLVKPFRNERVLSTLAEALRLRRSGA
ncbi:MAG: GAF domain-containing protein [Candidatus Rokubacteria bacterium]|nr:GAF domain-containing protein [Candidatus Rokubacteria bacterium]